MNKTPVGSPTSWGWADMPGVPSGLIAMWHGLIASIPSGWVICDGNNGTPNLLAKFIEGVATAGTNPGATGGATSKTTAGHTHTNPNTGAASARKDGTNTAGNWTAEGYHTHAQGNTGSRTDSISDIRPLFYDIAFLMRT